MTRRGAEDAFQTGSVLRKMASNERKFRNGSDMDDDMSDFPPARA